LAWRGDIAAEGVLALQRLAYQGLKIGPARFGVSADAGVIKLALRQAEMYGGRGDGSLTVDTTGPTPAVAARLKLAGVSLLPLLRDAGGVGWLDGRADVALDLKGKGQSERQIVETLQGQVALGVTEGAVTGIDIDKTMRALQRGRLDRLAPRREDRTPFSELTGSFDIANGIARNQDLKLVSTHVQLGGAGKIELAARRIDYTLNTKIMGGQADEGAVLKVGAIEIPVGIEGSLERPEFSIKGQQGLNDTIRQIGKNLRSRDVQDAIKGLLGGEGDKRVKPGELIDKLLKKE
jgi:AsmA protein